jgi:hypothetical protein
MTAKLIPAEITFKQCGRVIAVHLNGVFQCYWDPYRHRSEDAALNDLNAILTELSFVTA